MAQDRGGQATREALIDAAADLYASDGDASVRAIAARAGVNHGLVHHYFEGKDGLRKAVLDRLASVQARALVGVDVDDPIVLARAALLGVRNDERQWRILARALLNGDAELPMQTAYPVVQRLIATLCQRGVDDAHARVAEGIAVSFGWMLFAPWIRAATGLSEEQASQLLDNVIETHVQALLPE